MDICRSPIYKERDGKNGENRDTNRSRKANKYRCREAHKRRESWEKGARNTSSNGVCQGIQEGILPSQ